MNVQQQYLCFWLFPPVLHISFFFQNPLVCGFSPLFFRFVLFFFILSMCVCFLLRSCSPRTSVRKWGAGCLRGIHHGGVQ